jgi:hypothetical protein
VSIRRDDDAEQYDSLSYYDGAYNTLSGRLLKDFGSMKRFREERLDVRYSAVRVLDVRRVDEVTDSVEVTSQRKTKVGTDDEVCRYYHYRYQVRLASGVWTLDDRKALKDNSSLC